MTRFRFILESLRYHWRKHAAVALGVAVATAVLTGALLVGDSVRGSLRHLVLDRLGRIDEVLRTQRFFREELAAELAASPTFRDEFTDAVPVVIVSGTVERRGEGAPTRAGSVTVIGCDERFWRLGDGGPSTMPGDRQIVLNASLAAELRVGVGDEVLVGGVVGVAVGVFGSGVAVEVGVGASFVPDTMVNGPRWTVLVQSPSGP